LSDQIPQLFVPQSNTSIFSRSVWLRVIAMTAGMAGAGLEVDAEGVALLLLLVWVCTGIMIDEVGVKEQQWEETLQTP
jgi:hypothetical protein